MRSLPRLGVLAAALLLVPAAAAAPADAPIASAVLETPPVYDDEAGGSADSDDPGIWVDRANPADSLVVATMKNAGLDVFDLSGRSLQAITPAPGPTPESAPGRFNNVDIAEGMRVGRHKRVDVAVVSDRGRDRIRVYSIDPTAKRRSRPPLTDITAARVPRVFSPTEAAVDEQTTAYGLAVWPPDRSGRVFVSVSQRSRTAVALLEVPRSPESVARPGRGRLPHRRQARATHPVTLPRRAELRNREPGDRDREPFTALNSAQDVSQVGTELFLWDGSCGEQIAQAAQRRCPGRRRPTWPASRPSAPW